MKTKSNCPKCGGIGMGFKPNLGNGIPSAEYELNEEDTLYSTSLSSVLELANPVENWPWWETPLDRDISFSMFHNITPYPEGPTDTVEQHLGRIASFVQNPPEEFVISIDSYLVDNGLWPIDDGNHRLFAAIVLEHTKIKVEPVGFIDEVIEMLD